MNTDGYKMLHAATPRQQHQIIADVLGLQITWIERNCKGGKVEGAFIGEKPWRPLDDDGDAFRLAAQLGIKFEFLMKLGQAEAWSDVEKVRAVVPHGRHGWIEKVVRDAIFQVAIELAMRSILRKHIAEHGRTPDVGRNIPSVFPVPPAPATLTSEDCGAGDGNRTQNST